MLGAISLSFGNYEKYSIKSVIHSGLDTEDIQALHKIFTLESQKHIWLFCGIWVNKSQSVIYTSNLLSPSKIWNNFIDEL